MKKILCFDTETTGKVDFKREPNAPSQPRLVQLAALLTDEAGKEIASFNTLIRPEGFVIPPEASAIHGISTERAQACGLPIESVLTVFGELCLVADVLVAHNIGFDAFVMEGEFLRWNGHCDLDEAKCFCTMHAMTDICRLPKPLGRGYKWPQLQEAYQHAFGCGFEGAHDALADVRACSRIYFWLQQQARQ